MHTTHRPVITSKQLREKGFAEVAPGRYAKTGNSGISNNSGKVSKKRSGVSGRRHKVDMFMRLVFQETGIEPVPEHRFHSERKWRFDYAIPEHRIAIEVEGGIWTQGRHTRGKGYLGDMEKYNAANAAGWRLIRVTPQQLLTSATISQIRRLL